MLDSLKEDRKMSLSHFRYRILHFTFGVNPKTKEEAIEAGIPTFFYSHYCPLFHFTNLAILFIWLIVAFKCLRFVANKIKAAYDMWKASNSKTKKVISESEKRKKQYENDIICWLKSSWYAEPDFDRFWSRFSECILSESDISKEEAKAVWTKYRLIIAKKAEEKEIRSKKMRERMAFWVNFSQGLFKFVMDFAYVGLTLFLLYMAWSYQNAIWWLFGAVWNISVLALCLELLSLMLKTFLFLLCMIVVFKVLKKPADIFTDVFQAFWNYVCDRISLTQEFVYMFYEENCPKITVISDEEALLDKEVS